MSDQDTDGAVARFVEAQRQIVACVTRQYLAIAPAVLPTGRASTLYFPEPIPLPSLSGGASGLRLNANMAFAALAGTGSSSMPQIVVRQYVFGLLDTNVTELLVYHWHPASSGPDYPHIHVSAALNAKTDARARRQIDLDKLHIVTGPVTLQAVVRMLITEFHIRPLRSDWQARLEATSTH